MPPNDTAEYVRVKNEKLEYVGFMLCEKFHGQGKVTFADGNSYEGQSTVLGSFWIVTTRQAPGERD
jgi:hypothetical protein